MARAKVGTGELRAHQKDSAGAECIETSTGVGGAPTRAGFKENLLTRAGAPATVDPESPRTGLGGWTQTQRWESGGQDRNETVPRFMERSPGIPTFPAFSDAESTNAYNEPNRGKGKGRPRKDEHLG
jgi:hypothetical protein